MIQDELHKNAAGATGLGFGMLRVDPATAEHREALRDALVLGVDLFDLGDFRANPERFNAKADLFRGLVAEYAKRPVLAIVRGNLGSAATFRAPEGFGERVRWIYLVADPEFALGALEWDSARLYSLLAEELDTLEALARSGAIAAYGVGSAALTYAKSRPEALALEPLVLGRENVDWESAESAALNLRPENRRHFGWIEFPFNLYESEAATEENQVVGARNETLLRAARALGVRTIARRPFDAITEQGLRRIVAYPDHHRLDLYEAVRLTLETALAAEIEFLAKRNHARTVAGASAADLDPLWAHRLRDQLRHVVDPEQWKEIVRRRIVPDLEEVLARNSGEDVDPTVRTRYRDALEALLLSVKLFCEKNAAERNERLRAKLVEASPMLARKRRPADRDPALLALRIYRSVPELDYVLIGMRTPKYVRQVVESVAASPGDEPLPVTEIYETLIAAHTELEKGSP